MFQLPKWKSMSIPRNALAGINQFTLHFFVHINNQFNPFEYSILVSGIVSLAVPATRILYTQHGKVDKVVVSSSHQSPRCGVSRFRLAQSITNPLSVWSASTSSTQ